MIRSDQVAMELFLRFTSGDADHAAAAFRLWKRDPSLGFAKSLELTKPTRHTPSTTRPTPSAPYLTAKNSVDSATTQTQLDLVEEAIRRSPDLTISQRLALLDQCASKRAALSGRRMSRHDAYMAWRRDHPLEARAEDFKAETED